MYKVFFNEKKISFSLPGKITLSKPSFYFDSIPEVKALENSFFEFVESDLDESFWLSPQPEKLFECFRLVFKNIDAAGGVVVRNNKLLFINRNEKWDLPKGRIDKGESKKQAAVREVSEECGIVGQQIRRKLPSTYHVFQSPHKNSFGKWIFKETFWYEMDYSGEENGIPQTEEGITEIRWFARNELETVLKNTYSNLKQIVLLYLD